MGVLGGLGARKKGKEETQVKVARNARNTANYVIVARVIDGLLYISLP